MLYCSECGRKYKLISKKNECPYCVKERMWEKKKHWYLQNLFPAKIQSVILENDLHADINDVLAVVKQNKGLFFHGSPGIGKTTYACSVMLDIIKYTIVEMLPKKSYGFVTMLELLGEIKQTFSTTDTSVVVNKYREIDILILDDIGVEKITDWTLQVVYSIVNYRYMDMCPTIFTSNLDLKNLATILNNRIVSRILETCLIFNFDEHSTNFRKQGVKYGRD